jgi:aspartyl-tRNA(Asn)/glutamyl-tRNA(Gln) amidotransferase subunit B
VCLGLPGTLPVINQQAVELGLRAALALGCTPLPRSIFARKNYFYPDLPKGYQISQYETPLAVTGHLKINTADGEKTIRIRRVHLEEDTGKLSHISEPTPRSLVDLNRAGIPLLEIVTEPDLSSPAEARAYGMKLQQLLRAIAASNADMEKGQIRFEANISLRPRGSQQLGTRTEIKNLNSFRSMERAIAYEIQRQQEVLLAGSSVDQQTVGWDETAGVTFPQRDKEEAHDYRYFPEPDLPPLVVDSAWLQRVRAEMPALPKERVRQLQQNYGVPADLADLILSEPALERYFFACAALTTEAVDTARWLTGPLAGEMNNRGLSWDNLRVPPADTVDLLERLRTGSLSLPMAKTVLKKMLDSGESPREIITREGMAPVSDSVALRAAIQAIFDQHPAEVQSYLHGKTSLAQWFFGQVMSATRGQADPRVLRGLLAEMLANLPPL